MTPLPESVRDAAGEFPEGIDVGLDILRRRFPEMHFISLLSPGTAMPFTLVREVTFYGAWSVDSRFMREYFISIETFTEGLESDVDGPLIHRAAEDAFRRTALGHEAVVNNTGWIEGYELVEPARRVSDWASADGPVQMADLPAGMVRHMSIHRLSLKRSQVGPNVYDY